MQRYCSMCNQALTQLGIVGGCPQCGSRKWTTQPREQHRAYAAVRDAVLNGVLMKPLACPRCGSEKALIAHHANYAKPLEVEWMCQACHRKHHVIAGPGVNLGLPVAHKPRCTCLDCTETRSSVALC